MKSSFGNHRISCYCEKHTWDISEVHRKINNNEISFLHKFCFHFVTLFFVLCMHLSLSSALYKSELLFFDLLNFSQFVIVGLLHSFLIFMTSYDCSRLFVVILYVNVLCKYEFCIFCKLEKIQINISMWNVSILFLNIQLIYRADMKYDT